MVRNSLKYVSWKDYKAVTSGRKTVYQAPTEEAALMAMDAFAKVRDDKYPQISKSWRAHGKTSIRSSVIRRISARPSIRQTQSNP
ncbi:transposase [Salmonella enterica subsp. enterica]|uniref:Mutator family transposase n=1 Tax=Salmonella enterica I TaxID=59201 RepID=A0A3S4FQX2_SALET|nr:transposase [Salmonella enterica subsp. enterica]